MYEEKIAGQAVVSARSEVVDTARPYNALQEPAGCQLNKHSRKRPVFYCSVESTAPH